MSHHILLEVGSHFGAVTMPADLGERVQRRLDRDGVAGPVVHHPRARRWTFITGPGSPSTSVSAELFRLYTTVACAGSPVVLPSADDERTGYRVWVRPPGDTDAAPPLDTVIEAARAESGQAARPWIRRR
ncbi:hypothetical protein [Nocardia macrotermitis]|uniref:hypothetical protein n=1 Tax=Nocardia macrotermitis TaxID=2585198 RepID=UPI0029E7F450|nr:hypothetical protein [Nocardia macrotermitis]